MPIFYYFLNVHPIQGPRNTQGNGLLNAIAVRAVGGGIKNVYFKKVYDGYLLALDMNSPIF